MIVTGIVRTVTLREVVISDEGIAPLMPSGPCIRIHITYVEENYKDLIMGWKGDLCEELVEPGKRMDVHASDRPLVQGGWSW